MKSKLRIVLKNGNIREYHNNEYTDYIWKSEAFVVLYEEQWIAIFNWAEVREVMIIDEVEK